MNKLAWRLAAATCCLLAMPAQADVRTWTDVSGRTMQAEYIRVVDGEATFLKDGQLVAVPLARLSEADRTVIRALDAGREAQVQGAIPAAARPLPVPPEAASPRALDAPAAPSPPAGEPANGPLSAAAPLVAKKPAAPQIREWTDLHGNQTRAKFVRMNAGHVILLRGGRIVSLPFDSLSVVDREYVRELLAARGEAHLIPPPPDDENRSPSSAGPAEPNPAPIAPVPDAFAPAELPGAGPPIGAGGASGSRGASGPRDPLAELHERQQERLDAMQREQQERTARAAERAMQVAERQQAAIERQIGANRQTLVGTCSNCRNSLAPDQLGLSQCPHCGVVWQYEVDQFGNRRELPAGAVAASGDSQSGDSSFDETRRTIRSYRPVGRLFFRVILPAILGLGAVGAGAAARSRR